jgi:hypothetical protein
MGSRKGITKEAVRLGGVAQSEIQEPRRRLTRRGLRPTDAADESILLSCFHNQWMDVQSSIELSRREVKA